MRVAPPELVQVVIDQLERAVTSITEEELHRAKAQMKASLLMALESSEARVGQLLICSSNWRRLGLCEAR